MMQDTAYYQYLKALVVGFSFCFFMAAQFVWPYRRQFSTVAKNWLSNIPLGVANALFAGLVTTTWLVPITMAMGSRGFSLPWLQNWSDEGRLVVSVLALDLAAYVWHRANHRWTFLWRFHAVHHSDPVFDVSTALRFHPGEVLISAIIRLLVILFLGLPWEGVLAFEMLFTTSNFFEHANLRLPAALERVMGIIFVTPALHRLHHSTIEAQQQRNFATIFSVWDRLGRSFSWSWSSDMMAVGLSPDDIENRSFWELVLMPFKKPKKSQN